MKIDFRKKNQRIGRIYIWKEKNGTFACGINGTSQHFGNMDKEQVKSKVQFLQIVKI